MGKWWDGPDSHTSHGHTSSERDANVRESEGKDYSTNSAYSKSERIYDDGKVHVHEIHKVNTVTGESKTISVGREPRNSRSSDSNNSGSGK